MAHDRRSSQSVIGRRRAGLELRDAAPLRARRLNIERPIFRNGSRSGGESDLFLPPTPVRSSTVSAFERVAVRRKASPWEKRLLSGLGGPFVRLSLAVLALVLAVVLFLVLRAGDGRRSFTFHHVYGHLVFGDPSTRRSPGVGSVLVITGPKSLRPGFASSETPVSPAAARKAERIAGSDTTLARLLRMGDGTRVGVVDLWRLWGSPGGGADLFYVLSRPVAVNSDLPYVQIPINEGSCSKPYAAGWAHLRASGVTVLQVLVDLRRGRVVEIATNAKRGQVRPVKGKPYPTCSDSGPSG